MTKTNKSKEVEKEQPTTRVNVICLADVVVEDVQWLWKPYLPIGKVTLLEGDPESGKSYLSLAIAAYVSQGKTLPDYGVSAAGHQREPRNVLLFTAEDGAADTIKPRLLKVHGDEKRVFQIQGIIQTTDGKEVELGITLGQIGHIEEALKQYRPELVIVDPFQSFVGSDVDIHRSNEIRPVMDGLTKLATKYGCAVVLIRHLRKDTSGSVNHRGVGSVDIYAAARSVLLAGKNPIPPPILAIGSTGQLGDDKTRCVFAQTKCSLTKHGPTLAYAIDENGLTLDGPVSVTADDILQIVPKLTKRDDIEDWLMKSLADGPKSANDVKQAGRVENYSERQLNKAAERLGVKRKPAGFGESWMWSMPGPELVEPVEPAA